MRLHRWELPSRRLLTNGESRARTAVAYRSCRRSGLAPTIQAHRAAISRLRCLQAHLGFLNRPAVTRHICTRASVAPAIRERRGHQLVPHAWIVTKAWCPGPESSQRHHDLQLGPNAQRQLTRHHTQRPQPIGNACQMRLSGWKRPRSTDEPYVMALVNPAPKVASTEPCEAEAR